MRYATSLVAIIAALTLAAVAQVQRTGSESESAAAEEAVKLIVLEEAAATLEEQAYPDDRQHKVLALAEHGRVGQVLMQFQEGAYVPDHAVPGVVVAHVLEGHLQFTIDGTVHDVRAGQILVMDTDTEHDVRALEPSRMLRTISMDR